MALGATPTVVGAGKSDGRSGLRAALYVLGSALGGALIMTVSALLLGAIAQPRVWWIAAGVVAALFGGAALLRRPLHVVERGWQVPKSWYLRAGDSAFVAYGMALGVGVLTPIVFPTFYVLILLAGTVGPALAALLGAGYGALRGVLNSRLRAVPEQIPVLLGRHATHQRLVSAALLVVVAGVLVGCGGDDAAAGSRPRTGTPAAAATPPLDIKPIERGARCPVTRLVQTGGEFGAALGNGPLYPVIRDRGVIHVVPATDDRAPAGSYIEKVMWVAPPTFGGTAVIRGAARDGDGEVLFRYDDQITPRLELDASLGGSNPSGWYAWPASTIVPRPGCYAYQVDGPGFQQHITFRAVRAR